MPLSPPPSEPRHPIGVVSGRCGIAQDVLRAWERRYGAVVPHRTPTGRRLYTDDDIRRCRLLRELVRAGRRISDVARLPLAALEGLIAEDRDGTAPSPPRPAACARDSVEAGLRAIRDLDGAELRRVLTDASLAMSPAALREDLLAALLRETGRRWREGSLRIAHEHLVTAVVRSFVGARRAESPPAAGAPCIVMGTPAGQRHELGALLAAAAAEEVGWRALYVGPDLPADEIAAAVRESRAAAVGLSLVGVPGDPAIHEELRTVRHLVGNDVAMFAGGEAAVTYGPTLRAIRARIPDGLGELQEELDALRSRAARKGRAPEH
jgi:DNA-binding transcriptional MerR regulator/methylmalonyl-CoA mutase cobalamin-binding subunit